MVSEAEKKTISNNKEEQVFPTYSQRFHLLQSKHVTGQRRSKENRESTEGHAIPHGFSVKRGGKVLAQVILLACREG